eukprot:TRINITY_DN44131_c0_g1_i1.p1 TRINITY_DN44131_c0_g1~~TRINITY_DN44131_c0_g1_i1.p1  ORF type:complete len:381 (-),score=63.35 TRINITY_DN44131_c0_g1_i1:198-1340(-)
MLGHAALALAISLSSVHGLHFRHSQPPQISSCAATEAGLVVRWSLIPGANQYEVQLLTSSAGYPAAAFATAGSSATFPSVAVNASYWVRMRAHQADAPSLAGNWSIAGDVLACEVLSKPIQKARTNRSHDGSFRLPVVRQSEYTYEIDYLANHDSADMLGVATFGTSTAAAAANASFLNTSLANETFTQYCVETLPAQLSFDTRNKNGSFFADYLSCNWEYPLTPWNPQCVCEIWDDRVIAGQDPPLSVCHRNGHPEQHCTLADTVDRSCTCMCSQAGANASSRFTGTQPCFAYGPEQLGTWYSHPAGSECAEGEAMGSCTWRRGAEMRVIRGSQLLANGFVFPLPPDPSNATMQTIVHRNVLAYRKAFAQAGLGELECN